MLRNKKDLNNLTLCLKELEKEEQVKTKFSRRKERLEIQERESNKTIENINKTKPWFFEKIKKKKKDKSSEMKEK